VPEGLRLALTTLTVLPVRGPRALDRRTAGAAMTWAPLVGLLLALPAAGLLHGLRVLSSGDPLPAVLTVALLALLTRGLHLDGLVDTVDGLASYRPAEQAREVMKSPGVGALGVAALVLVLGVQTAALAQAGREHHGTLSVLLAVVVSRIAVTASCTPATPAASSTGLGALVAGTVRPWVPLVLAAAATAAFTGLSLLDGDESAAPTADVVLAVVASLGSAWLLRRHAVRRLGGLTGDVLGAQVEVTTAVVLTVMALAPLSPAG